MMKPNILLLGSSGFLGGKIAELAPPDVSLWLAYREHRPAGKNAVRVDLLGDQTVMQTLHRLKPDVVIHAARICPSDNDDQQAASATSNLVAAVNAIGATLVYFSTDAVFDGQKGNYREDDTPNPVTDYGKAKLAAEEIIQHRCRNSIIIRTSYVYGRSRGQWDKRISELMQKASMGHEVKCFQDMYRSPTDVRDLATACWRLIGEKFSGTMHVAGERKSVFEFHQEIAKGLGLDLDLIKPDSIINSPRHIAPDTSLNTDLARKVINFSPRPIPDIFRFA